MCMYIISTIYQHDMGTNNANLKESHSQKKSTQTATVNSAQVLPAVQRRPWTKIQNEWRSLGSHVSTYIMSLYFMSIRLRRLS